jgi:hypothetical protein
MRYSGPRPNVGREKRELKSIHLYITEKGARLRRMELARPFQALLKRCKRGFLDSTNRNCMARAEAHSRNYWAAFGAIDYRECHSSLPLNDLLLLLTTELAVSEGTFDPYDGTSAGRIAVTTNKG